MRRINDDESAVAGFFEDLPTLLIVLIATTLFISTLVNTVTTYRDYKETEYRRENLDQFVEEIRRWDYLVLEEEGQFIGGRLLNLNKTKMERNFNKTALQHDYRIFIDDRSDYPKEFDVVVETKEIPDDVEVYSKSTAVTVVDEMGNEHLCEMIVSIW